MLCYIHQSKMACSVASVRRHNLLKNFKCMINSMPDGCSPCPKSPVIEIYDPMPKPAIPLGGPCPTTPLDPTIPVPHVASPSNPCGGCCIPIISPQPVPCIPLSRACPVPEQPCVPCNPPQMMVAFRRRACPSICGGGCGPCGPCGGCGPCVELHASQLKRCIDCHKRNGLQDDCPRNFGNVGCTGGGCCGPCGGGSCGGGGCCADFVAEYQCYPAYFKMPPGCGPISGPCGPLPCGPACMPAGGPCGPGACCPTTPGGPCVPMIPTMEMTTTPPECPCCPGPCLPQCAQPVPTIALPPCPPITVPAPPPVIPTPVPVPVPTPVYPSCPPPCPTPCCVAPCCPC